jgi:hypothetical protein
LNTLDILDVANHTNYSNHHCAIFRQWISHHFSPSNTEVFMDFRGKFWVIGREFRHRLCELEVKKFKYFLSRSTIYLPSIYHIFTYKHLDHDDKQSGIAQSQGRYLLKESTKFRAFEPALFPCLFCELFKQNRQKMACNSYKMEEKSH